MTHKKEVVFSLLFVIMVYVQAAVIKIMEIRLKITGLQENHLFKKKLLRVQTIQTMQTAARHQRQN